MVSFHHFIMSSICILERASDRLYTLILSLVYIIPDILLLVFITAVCRLFFVGLAVVSFCQRGQTPLKKSTKAICFSLLYSTFINTMFDMTFLQAAHFMLKQN